MKARYLTTCVGRALKGQTENPIIAAFFDAGRNVVHVRFNDGTETKIPGFAEVQLAPEKR